MLSACALPDRLPVQEVAPSTDATSSSKDAEKQNNSKLILPEPFIIDNKTKQHRFLITQLTEKK